MLASPAVRAGPQAPATQQAPPAGQTTPPAGQAPAAAAGQRHTIRAVTEEVVLDLVARDKKGRAVRDLKPEEVRVLEDGAKQEIRGFRLVETGAPPAPAEGGGGVQPDPLRQINLVTMIFERLGNEARHLARQGALDFLNNELRQNVLVAVFTIDQRLYVMQQFTNDRKLLRQAIERATYGGYTQFTSQSDSIRQELETVAAAASSAQGQEAGIGRGNPPGAGMGGSLAEAALAQMTLQMLQFTEEMQRTQEGRSSIFALLGLVREQRRLAGRKTVLYFSEGLHVPPNLVEYFRATIGEANRANVSFYAVDARGLLTQGMNASTQGALAQAAAVSQRQATDPDSPVTREMVMLGENAEATLRLNTQETLANIAESTGGFLVANTNDLRVGMRKVAEDVRSYYELTYRPPSTVYDGKFRRISVEVTRPGVVLQARSGYFALPPMPGAPMLPYEAPMLAALSSVPMPREFDYQARALHFGRRADGALEHTVVIEVPLVNFTFAVDNKTSLYRTRFSLMALVKDAEGRIVQKLSQNYPLEGPLDKLPALQKGHVLFARNVRLQPGRYTLETAAVDPETRKTSARRTVLIVPPSPKRVRLSSISLVKRLDPLTPGDQDPDDPFRLEKSRIIPMLNETLKPGTGAAVSVYFIIYPDSAETQKPQLLIEFLRDGEVIARAPVELPAPDTQGRLPYLGTIPVEKLTPGQYEIRVVVRQGAGASEEHAFFTVSE